METKTIITIVCTIINIAIFVMTAEEIHAEFPKAWNRRADNA